MKLSVKQLLILSIGILITSCSPKSEDANGSLKIKTVKAVKLNDNSSQEFPFISKPYRSSELSFRVGGVVNDLDIFPGKYYKQGDVIAAIDPRDYQVKFEKIKAVYDQSCSEYKRVESLFNLNNISASAYEKTKSDYETAHANFTAVKNELGDTRVTAPFNGYVQDVKFERYQDIKPSQALCSFIDIERLKIEFFVPQQIAVSVSQGDYVNVRFDALPDRVFQARAEAISKSASKNNLSYIITAVLSNKENEFPAGMSGKVLITNDSAGGSSLALPQHIIRNNSQTGPYVWVNSNGVAKSCNVKTGKLMRNGMMEITSGVSLNDVIISTGMELISEGMPVEVINRK